MWECCGCPHDVFEAVGCSVTSYADEGVADDNFHRPGRPSGDLFQFGDVRDQPPNCVWTIVDSGDDRDANWYAQPGFHIVNKLGYVMNRKPWSDSTRNAIRTTWTTVRASCPGNPHSPFLGGARGKKDGATRPLTVT